MISRFGVTGIAMAATLVLSEGERSLDLPCHYDSPVMSQVEGRLADSPRSRQMYDAYLTGTVYLP